MRLLTIILLLSTLVSAQGGTFSGYGSGCTTNPAFMPVLQQTLNNAPNIGQPFVIRYSNVPGSGVGITGTLLVFFGLYPTQTPTPFPGCTSLTSNDLTITGLLQMNGTQQFFQAFTMPNEPFLIGFTFFTQSLLYSSAPPPRNGFTVTNGLRFTIGR